MPNVREIYAALDRSFRGAGYSQTITQAPVVQMAEAVADMLGQSLNVKAFGAVGDGVTDDTDAIQAAVDALVALGGGTLIWADAYLTDTIAVRGSNVTIVAGANGNAVNLDGNVRHAFQIFPSSLQGIIDDTSRPAAFPSGINGEGYETLMYEPTDADRLRNVEIRGLNYAYVGEDAGQGRFVDAYSVDNLRVYDNKARDGGNCVTAWYCRDVDIARNDLTPTGTNLYFPVFLFKSYGEVHHNILSNGSNCFDAKGCYPQAGKAVTEAFDAGYNFYHPVRFFNNRVSSFTLAGATSGYRDNSGDDICSVAVGITKAAWFGETWGVEYFNNTFQNTASLAIDAAAVITNINSRYHKAWGNTCYGAGFLSLASYACEFSGNVIVKHTQSSTPAISLNGGTFGADAANSVACVVRGNRIHDQVTVDAAIRIKGGDYCEISDNRVFGAPTGANTIRVDSGSSATTSKDNAVLRNTVSKTATDFGYPFRSTGADRTILDGNRAYGGWYSGNALDSDGSADNHYLRGVVSADTAHVSVGTPGTCYVGQNFGDQNETTAVTGYADEMAVNGAVSAGWRQPVRFGAYFLWVDSTGDLRIESTKPTSDTDGVVVGTQT